MRLLRLSILFTSLVAVVTIVILYNFSVDIFQPKKTYPTYVHKTLFLDRNFSEKEVLFITQGAMAWSEATNHIVDFDIVTLPNTDIPVTKNDIVFIKVNPDYPNIIVLDSINKKTTLGLYDDEAIIHTIELVSDRIDDEEYPSVVMHELGHALGLKHNEGLDGIGTLMYPTIGLGANYITEDDLKNFCKLYHCDASKLKH